MKVILKKTGEVKEVADGYARNYLLPKGEAVIATPDAIAKIEAKQKQEQDQTAKSAEEWKGIAEQLKTLTVEVAVAANEDGTLFGAVSESDIITALKAHNIYIDPAWLKIEEPIKKTGETAAQLEFPNNDKASVSITVSAK